MNKTEYPAIGEALYTTTLPNGLPIYVIPKPGYRKSYAVFATNYGGVDRRFSLDGRTIETPAGVAHYLEHKMFDTPEGDALMKLEAAGANPNAFTSDAMTAYHFECTGRFEESLRTLLGFVSVPYFTQQSVDKERGIIAQEIRMCEDNPDDAVYLNLMRLLYARGPLRDSVAGTVESIAQITPQVLYDCHKVFYHPSNMVLCVAGDVDPDMVERATLDILTPESAPLPGRDYDIEDTLEPADTLVRRDMEVAAPIFLAGLKLGRMVTGPEALRERVTASLALQCLCGRSSPLYLRLYGEGLLNATFGAGVDHAAGHSVAAFGGESKDPAAVRDALAAEFAAAAQNGIDPALFQRQKSAAWGSHIRALNNFQGLALSMAEGRFAGYQPLDVFPVLNDVSADDVSAWVRDRLAGRTLALSVIYPKEG